MKCNLTIQTEAALKDVQYEPNLVPHMKTTLVGFEKNIICHNYKKKIGFGSLLPTVNKTV